MGALLFQNARTIGLWLQLFAFGVYIVYLKRYAAILYHRRHEGNLSIWPPAICLLMFVTTVMVLLVNMMHGYSALSVPDAHQRPDPTLIYADVSSALTVTRNAATVSLAIISDFIMVYRTFIVWNRKIVAIVGPSGFLLADITLGIWATWTLSRTRTGTEPITEGVAVPVQYFFAITFALNMLCAGMICWKIWRVHSRIPPRAFGMGHNPTGRVFEVMIETAALYCAHLLILVISDRARSNIFFVFLDPLPPVTALVFTVLIVRNRTTHEDKAPTSILAPGESEHPRRRGEV